MFVGVFQDAMTGMTGDDVGHVTDGIHVTLPFLTSLVMLEM